MDEKTKMRNGQIADMNSAECQQSFIRCKAILLKMNKLSAFDKDYRLLVEELIPGIDQTSVVTPPFYCDHGDGVRLGKSVFINANCTFLDGGYITIGDHTLVGPNVQIYTPSHPMNYLERRSALETALPVVIGNDCWIGGGAIICPGVTIGDRTIIGAGSVVTKDIPSDSVAVGNPATIKKRNI